MCHDERRMNGNGRFLALWFRRGVNVQQVCRSHRRCRAAADVVLRSAEEPFCSVALSWLCCRRYAVTNIRVKKQEPRWLILVGTRCCPGLILKSFVILVLIMMIKAKNVLRSIADDARQHLACILCMFFESRA